MVSRRLRSLARPTLIGLVALLLLIDVVAPSTVRSDPPSGAETSADLMPLAVEAQGLSRSVFLPRVAKKHMDGAPLPWGVQMLGIDNGNGLAQLPGLGVKWVRAPLSWAEIEPENTTPDGYRWGATDRMFQRAADAGLVPIVTIGDNPRWAATYPGGPITPSQLSEFGQFVGALASRYGAAPYGIKYWEFYNEPDNGDYETYWWVGGLWGGHGREYAQMLKVAYGAVKKADPQAKVVMGGLAHDWLRGVDRGGIFDPNFLDDVLAGGGGRYFDIMNFHYYPAFDTGFNRGGRNGWNGWDEERGSRGLIGKTTYLRRKLAEYGFANKPIICTEAGWWSNADAPADARLGPGSNEIQSRYVVKFNVLAQEAKLGVLIWFTLVDSSWDANRRWGLLSDTLTPKPSYQAFQLLAKELAGATHERLMQPSELASAEVEGHLFRLPAGRGERVVLWAPPGQPLTVRLEARELKVTDKFGAQRLALSDTESLIDGRVGLTVTEDPIYVEVVR